MSSEVEACPECTKRCLHLHRKTNSLSSVTSFFKVMFGDRFSEVLYFPPVFAATVSRLVNKKVVLEDSLGQQWKVTVSNCEGSLAFREGWSAFSSEHSLEIGDFLTFNHIMDLHFNVTIYTKTGCEKEFANKSNMRKRTRSNCPVLETTNEGLTYPQASCPSVGSGSNVALSQDKCCATCYRDLNLNLNQDKRPKYQSSNERNGSLCKADIVDYSYAFINQNKDVGLEENRSPLFDLFSMEMQTTNFCVNEITTKKVAGDELNPNRASTSLNAAIDVSRINNARVDIKGDKSLCFEEADIKRSVSDNNPCHDKTIEVPFITSATNSDRNVERFCDMPLKSVKDCQNIPAVCDTPSTITRHDHQESNNKHTFPIDHSHGMKLEYPPISLEVKKCPHGDVKKTTKTDMNNYEDFIGQISVSKVKEELLEKSNQSGSDGNDSNADSIATRAHVSCIVAKDTLSFLELPTSLQSPCSRARKNPEKRRLVFLRDPRKRLWPILYHEMPNVHVLTSGWEAFCSANKIQSGDECLFHVEDELERIYEVRVRKCKN
ncbi:uncharacterized protein LOC111802479 [Cucurbita pepo subsp. pepo]|uniref:uncharacterized protein LOC111802479 n=1 Tax=Cucurbita pepo subsp. pepo TaxID=3664 RepID=UPI000C9D8EE4|nr:uncharacterized protein LOC111802479 [Cucurbita pepo subsp. pepo]